ncbi:MAG: TIM44-like domain-containing protein [Sulfuritalea sp.]|nr:TIM44-like domain-containing protein [Sulfuritalea sp.]
MKSLSLLAVVVALGLSIGASNAEAAKRFGSGKASGMQRQMTPPAKAPDAAPAQKQATAAAAAPAAAAPAAAAQTGRSWMGPVAGLAAGLGLAALASHFGFGEELASFMMMALLAFVVIAAIGFFMRKRAAGQQPALAGAAAGRAQNAFQYAANRVEPVDTASRGYKVSMPAAAASPGITDASPAAASIPADFDVAGFVRHAKVHYIRLQAANDAGNLDDIREFTTPEMFAEARLTIAERAGQTQATDVLAIEADVIDVVEEDTRYVVSVRFTGQIREDNGPAESVDEIWHLVKPRNGSGGWLLAGIQQVE